MTGTSEPEILESRSKELLLEQQVKELTQELCKTREDVEVARATLAAQSTLADTQEEVEATSRATQRRAQAEMLGAQSAIAAINCLALALRLSAMSVRLGDTTEPNPSPTVANISLQEAVKLLEDRVSRIEPVCRGHATSLARSSGAFVAAALLCRDRERGLESLRDAVAADTRRFVRSQGADFHSLVDQVVVDAMEVEQQHVSAPQMQGGGRATGTAGTSNKP
ncbi:unnamed protein product [Urochloa humidicola]